jgi:hypothetical protein
MRADADQPRRQEPALASSRSRSNPTRATFSTDDLGGVRRQEALVDILRDGREGSTMVRLALRARTPAEAPEMASTRHIKRARRGTEANRVRLAGPILFLWSMTSRTGAGSSGRGTSESHASDRRLRVRKAHWVVLPHRERAGSERVQTTGDTERVVRVVGERRRQVDARAG